MPMWPCSCWVIDEPNDYNSAEDCQEVRAFSAEYLACNDDGCYNARRTTCKSIHVLCMNVELNKCKIIKQCRSSF